MYYFFRFFENLVCFQIDRFLTILFCIFAIIVFLRYKDILALKRGKFIFRGVCFGLPIIIGLTVGMYLYRLPRGLSGNYYNNPSWADNPVKLSRWLDTNEQALDRKIDLKPHNFKELRGRSFSVIWQGYVDIRDDYSLDVLSNFGTWLYIDESLTDGPYKIDFGTAAAHNYIRKGWSYNEQWEGNPNLTFIWSSDDHSEFYLGGDELTDYQLSIRCLPFIYEGSPPQKITISINDIDVNTITLAPGWKTYSIPVPRSVLQGIVPGFFRVKFTYSNVVRPVDVLKGSKEQRRLAVAFDFAIMEKADDIAHRSDVVQEFSKALYFSPGVHHIMLKVLQDRKPDPFIQLVWQSKKSGKQNIIPEDFLFPATTPPERIHQRVTMEWAILGGIIVAKMFFIVPSGILFIIFIIRKIQIIIFQNPKKLLIRVLSILKFLYSKCTVKRKFSEIFDKKIVLKKIRKLYTNTALILLNTLVIFIVINGVLWIGEVIKKNIENMLVNKKGKSNPVSQKYRVNLQTVYPGHDLETINAMLNETWSRPYVYEPFTQFKERPYRGNYVNVSEYGFRFVAHQGIWPPDKNAFNIFLFGGSTMFGYGVADNQTVASYLQNLLDEDEHISFPIYIYNFGRGNYYSTQELILFLRLLSGEHVPDMAIFIDGMNEFYYNKDKPLFTSRFNKFVNESYNRKLETNLKENLENSILNKLPVYRIALGLKRTFFQSFDRENTEKNDTSQSMNTEMYNNKERIKNVIDRYINNKKIIEALGNAYKVKTVFVWQPVPLYKYDLKYHVFAVEGFGDHTYSKYGYLYMKAYINHNPLGNNFIWAADIQENFQEPLYVDKVHYSAKMSKLLAEYIGHEILKRDLL